MDAKTEPIAKPGTISGPCPKCGETVALDIIQDIDIILTAIGELTEPGPSRFIRLHALKFKHAGEELRAVMAMQKEGKR
jgi:hypothetical protein